MNLGPQIAYLALNERTPVYSSDDSEIGAVAHVLAAEDEDIFDGLVITHHHTGHRFVDAEHIDRIYEQGVVLKLDAAACQTLPEPTANPAVMHGDPAESGGDRLREKLIRAWDRLSGNY